MMPLEPKIAITFTGGIDSTSLAYQLSRQLDQRYNGESPTFGAFGEVFLLACDYGQATWTKTYELLKLHCAYINEKCLHLRAIPVPMQVKLPNWATEGGLFEKGYVPEVAEPIINYSEQKKTYGYALVEGRNTFLFTHMFSYCSTFKIPVLYSGHQYGPDEWKNFDSYRHRTEDFGPMFIDRMNLVQELGFSERVRLEAPFLSNRYSKQEICKIGITHGLDLKDTYSCQFYPRCGKCDNCLCRTDNFGKLGLDHE